MLSPLLIVLRNQPWLGSDVPDYDDYLVLGSFMWPRCSGGFVLLGTDDPLHAWRARGLALFDGLGKSARTASVIGDATPEPPG